MNVSTQFAPPFKLIAPFFILGVLTYVLSSFLVFGFDVSAVHNFNPEVLAWVHLYLLGFVMMIIFGAMAQLVPVVLEVGHFSVELYRVVYPLLLLGALMMGAGFLYLPILLPFGGTVAFTAFGVFLFETFATILRVKKLNFVIISVGVANLFLLLGLIAGVVLALGYSGIAKVDLIAVLKLHLYFVLFGYVGVTIMGLSLVLLPMFWLSHSFSRVFVKAAFVALCAGLFSLAIGVLLQSKIFENIGYILNFAALFAYAYQIALIYAKRVRKQRDIYYKSMVFSYVSFVVSLCLAVGYFFVFSTSLLLTSAFVGFIGFIGFLIMGHLYKIVPFLVWFERFSPLVGKQKVPMLEDMVPKQSASMQFFLSALGTVVTAVGLFVANSDVFYGGVSFLSVGAVFLFKDIVYMINYKEAKDV
jgi:hypothetical protein